ncbi:hypothetical protein ACTGW9_11630, partial [Streptococcus suis]
WGQTLPLNPPFNVQSTQQQFVSNDYVEPFVSYGYIVDQKFDWGNHAGVSGGLEQIILQPLVQVQNPLPSGITTHM